MTLVFSPEALQRPGTVGRIQLGGSIKICTENGDELPTGAVGDIFVRMPAFGQFIILATPTGTVGKTSTDTLVSATWGGWIKTVFYSSPIVKRI
jgi:hypothetical protein